MRAEFALLSLLLASGCASHDGGNDAPPAPPRDSERDFAWSEATACPVPRFEALGVVVDGELWVMGGFLSLLPQALEGAVAARVVRRSS